LSACQVFDESTIFEFIASQQQHWSHVQSGHANGDLDPLHSFGLQPQSAHFISM
jgi:hypothetical protein